MAHDCLKKCQFARVFSGESVKVGQGVKTKEPGQPYDLHDTVTFYDSYHSYEKGTKPW